MVKFHAAARLVLALALVAGGALAQDPPAPPVDPPAPTAPAPEPVPTPTPAPSPLEDPMLPTMRRVAVSLGLTLFECPDNIKTYLLPELTHSMCGEYTNDYRSFVADMALAASRAGIRQDTPWDRGGTGWVWSGFVAPQGKAIVLWIPYKEFDNAVVMLWK